MLLLKRGYLSSQRMEWDLWRLCNYYTQSRSKTATAQFKAVATAVGIFSLQTKLLPDVQIAAQTKQTQWKIQFALIWLISNATWHKFPSTNINFHLQVKSYTTRCIELAEINQQIRKPECRVVTGA